MQPLIEVDIDCPYCGESISLLVDDSVPEQDYIEDCQVCCQPIELCARCDGTEPLRLEVRRQDDC